MKTLGLGWRNAVVGGEETLVLGWMNVVLGFVFGYMLALGREGSVFDLVFKRFGGAHPGSFGIPLWEVFLHARVEEESVAEEVLEVRVMLSFSTSSLA